MNKRASIKDNSPLDDFLGPPPQTVSAQEGRNVTKTSSAPKHQNDLERTTVYLRPDQHATIESLKAELRKRRIKTDKSLLYRVAIDYLAEQDIEEIVTIVTKHQMH